MTPDPDIANNARPEFVMSRGNNYRLLAINRSSAEDVMRVEVWYHHLSGIADWEIVYTSPDEDECERKLHDTYGQALAMVEGLESESAWSVPVLTYRAAFEDYDQNVTMRYAFSYGNGETTWGDAALTDGAGESWAVTQPWGPTNAVAAPQTCLIGDCSGTEPGHTFDLPFGAAWTDEHQSNNSEIWTRRFPFSAASCGP